MYYILDYACYAIYEPDRAFPKYKTANAIIQKDSIVVAFQIILLTRKANRPDNINAKEQINICAAALNGSICDDVNKYIRSNSIISVPNNILAFSNNKQKIEKTSSFLSLKIIVSWLLLERRTQPVIVNSEAIAYIK